MAIVTLTTDFGTADGYVGAMKGVILSLAPGTTLVDLTHDVPRHDVAAAAHALLTSTPLFPPSTIHCAVIDPGVGGARAEVVVSAGGHYFVGPDNGIFALVARAPDAAHAIQAPAFRRSVVAPTFHGRDVFAAAAAALARGEALSSAGPAVELRGTLGEAPPRTAPGRVIGEVVHIDRYGNLVSDVAIADLNAAGIAAPGTEVTVMVSRRTVRGIARTYEDVAPGKLLAYVGSSGTLEVAVREGSAADALGVGRGAEIEIVAVEPPSR
jgi:S-adenosyl-L-methionine hydrolase (adenosine-forming)